MKRQIRKGVFETNSSSTHSISFCKKELERNNMPIDCDGYIHARFGEFGWEIANYYDQENKLSYLLTMAMHLNGFCTFYGDDIDEDIEHFMNTDDFKRISGDIADYVGCNGIIIDNSEGYIDHQSREDYFTLDQFLNENCTDIINFVFGNVVVHTDNDNY